MDFLDSLNSLSGAEPASATNSGALQKGKYTGEITDAYIENHEKFGPLIQLEFTDSVSNRKVWKSYYLSGDWAEDNMSRAKAQLTAVGLPVWGEGEAKKIPEMLQPLKGKKVEVYVGVNKKGKNWFSIERELGASEATSVLDDVTPSFDTDEEMPF